MYDLIFYYNFIVRFFDYKIIIYQTLRKECSTTWGAANKWLKKGLNSKMIAI